MDRREIELKVLARARRKLGREEAEVTLDEPWVNYGADSLDTADLVMDLEEEFRIGIPDDIETRIRSLGDAVTYIVEQIEKKDRARRAGGESAGPAGGKAPSKGKERKRQRP